MPKLTTHTKNGAVKSIGSKLSEVAAKDKTNTEPLWKGPCDQGSCGGVTQSMLNWYLFDMERFRIRYILGLKEEDRFSHYKEYGNFWHILEECHAAGMTEDQGREQLLGYVKQLQRRYMTEQKEIVKWYNICIHQFPVYVKHWTKDKEYKKRVPFLEEKVFHVPLLLPSGRTVYLKGKFDSVGVYPKKFVELQENKSKGEVEAEVIQQRLNFDLQTMFYVRALQLYLTLIPEGSTLNTLPIRVRYNVVVRPLSGGKHSIKQRKGRGKNLVGAETESEFYKRLQQEIEGAVDSNGNNFFFHRWLCDISEQDISRFQVLCLYNVLDNLCDDYEWWQYCHTNEVNPFHTQNRKVYFKEHTRRHYVAPFGLYNPIAEGRGTPYDEFILSNGRSTRGLMRDNNLFPELVEG